MVFFNLYLNAAQQIDLASRVRRQGRIWTTFSHYRDGGGKSWARVHIHDSGPGIHHDDWERAFDPGYSTKPNGSGLGLYICRHVLRDISSTVSVTSSRIWDGTTVTVSLPLAGERPS
jgi:signal transduction histidine kinase